jgi:hypothetical protein
VIRGQSVGHETPLIVIGDAADEAEDDRFRAAGASGFFRKPLDGVALEAVLADVVQIPGEQQRQRA